MTTPSKPAKPDRTHSQAAPAVWFMPQKDAPPIHLRAWTDAELEAHRRMIRSMEKSRPH